MQHTSAGTPSKKAPGSVRQQAPPISLQATASAAPAHGVFTTDSDAPSIGNSDPRVKNLLRIYHGMDVLMAIQSHHQNSLEVNDRITKAFEEGDGQDPNHSATESALTVLALELNVLIRPGDQAVPHSGTASSTVRYTRIFPNIHKSILIWSPIHRETAADYRSTPTPASNMR